jgi:diguanylate cyclase (GGDEF)-like protein
VNDLHGHIIGDKLLCTISEKLQAIFIGKDCIISRIGGDEFVICLSLNSYSLEESRSQFDAIAQQMLTVISEPLILGNGTLSCSVSIGAVLLDGEKMDSDEALKLADLALYHAKRNGRNTSQFYDTEFEQQESQLRLFEQELEAAVELNQFRLYYQPQNEVISNKVVKLEALIRWIHPLKGIIYPDNFIPYLERNGLITKVGAWVIDQGCCQLRRWIDKGITDVVLSVNVSAHQFKLDDFVATVITSLETYNIPAHQLELELTEGVAVADVDKTIKKMQAINNLGVLIALDDFGTGYSSLAYLKFFPIHTLKIDKSFTDGLPSDGYDTAIVKTTMMMAYHLGLTVVAEGVESIEQLEFLKEQGCQLYQGYLFSPPLEQERIEKILLEHLR